MAHKVIMLKLIRIKQHDEIKQTIHYLRNCTRKSEESKQNCVKIHCMTVSTGIGNYAVGASWCNDLYYITLYNCRPAMTALCSSLLIFHLIIVLRFEAYYRSDYQLISYSIRCNDLYFSILSHIAM